MTRTEDTSVHSLFRYADAPLARISSSSCYRSALRNRSGSSAIWTILFLLGFALLRNGSPPIANIARWLRPAIAGAGLTVLALCLVSASRQNRVYTAMHAAPFRAGTPEITLNQAAIHNFHPSETQFFP